jgi:hypothetical protein
VGFRFGTETLSFAEAEARSAEGSFPYPVPLIRALAEERGSTEPSASVLAGCLRRFALKLEVPYHIKPTAGLPALFGTAFHSLLEKHTEVGVGQGAELHLWSAVTTTKGPVILRGTLDYLHEGHVLRDYKTKKFLPQGFTPPREHKAQVNVYNWLAWRNGYQPAPKYELVYISQDWLSRFTGDTSPLELTQRWIEQRLSAWTEAKAAGELPPPVPELFQVDGKGKMLAPCAYCEVREQCLARLPKVDSPFAEDDK